MTGTATMRTNPKRDGFTLIELMIVMVITAILASIAINLFWKAKDRGLQSTLESDLRTAAVQQEVYFERYGRYAATPTEVPGYAASPGVILAINYAQNNGWAGIATHPGLPVVTCGLLVGDAPAGSAGPAVRVGVITCN